jgi:signal transduction histidine kinase
MCSVTGDDRLRRALTAIRETSKHALREMRATLGQLRQGAENGAIQMASGGLDRLPALQEAVIAAGAPVTIGSWRAATRCSRRASPGR